MLLDCQIAPSLGNTRFDENLDQLYRAHRDNIYRYLRARLRNDDVTSDLTQETFLRFATQRADTTVNQPASYLFRIAFNLAIDHLRLEKRRRTETVAPATLVEVSEDLPQPAEAADAREQIERLRKSVQELPERTRQVLILHRLKEFTYSEVAAKLGISESSVQKHLAKALTHVRRNVNPA